MTRVSRLGIFVIIVTTIWNIPASCASLHHDRYNAIQSLLDQYSRSITIALLSDDTHLPFMIAQNHPAVCVVIDPDKQGNLEKSCYNHSYNRSVVLLKILSAPWMYVYLGECEHIDVCFVSSFVNRFTIEWQKECYSSSTDTCRILLY